MSARTTAVRFGVSVRNGDAMLRFSPRGGDRGSTVVCFGICVCDGDVMLGVARSRRMPSVKRRRSLTVLEGLAFRGEHLELPLGFDEVCSVRGRTPARAVARLGDVYRARLASMQRFVDSHAMTESEKAKLAALRGKARQRSQ